MARNNDQTNHIVTTTAEANATTLPLWRVNYNYTVNGNLRQGSYILPANNPTEAKEQAHKTLSDRFANTGSYFKISKVIAF